MGLFYYMAVLFIVSSRGWARRAAPILLGWSPLCKASDEYGAAAIEEDDTATAVRL